MRQEENICQYHTCQRAIHVLTLPGYISLCIFQFKYFVLCPFALYLMVFFNRFVFEYFVPNIQLHLKTRTYWVVDFTVLKYFTSNLNSAKLSQ